jgi:2-polyprenyl-3-methyl-5-hydroxy-6-metoxy-1,4-benzoquinol methylase
MPEAQYQEYDKLPRHSLGLMSNEAWERDPKMLGIRLARYKFVSKMLAGKKCVAEVGCGDGWFSRVVAKEVGELHLYDFDKKFIDEWYNRQQPSNTSARVHDIMWGELEEAPFNAIYSLDVMEHFHYGDEMDTYLTNIKASLSPEGVFIVGMPSLESQKYASEPSKEGHVGCLSQDELREVLSAHYHNVFLLGLNDESLHCGFGAMTHYHLGICTGVKQRG